MAEPRIQYAKTSDGVSIAYATAGEGKALVLMYTIPIRHVELELKLTTTTRELAAGLPALGRRLVVFDPRGMGSSSRDIKTLSPEGFLLDLEAVVDQLALDEFDLWALTNTCPLAMEYSAKHPKRVSHLVLQAPYAEAAELHGPYVETMLNMLRSQDWDFFVDHWPRVTLGWEDATQAQVTSAIMRKATTPDLHRLIVNALVSVDVSRSLAEIRSPALVCYWEGAWVPIELSRAVAAGIPGAEFVAVQDRRDLWPPVAQFLGISVYPQAEEEATSLTGTAIILFADIVDSTALTEQLGDAVFREKARSLDSSLRTIIRDASGTPIEGKLLGDGVLATFSSASQAIEAALRCGAAGDEAGLALHLGIHAGDVIREENNVYGGAVNIAARIAGASTPGEVLVSQTVRDLARTSAGVSFEDRGRKTLRGVEGRQRLFAVREQTED